MLDCSFDHTGPILVEKLMNLNHSTMKKYFPYVILTAILFSFLIISCSDKSSMTGGNAKLEVRLTDDPAAYDAINLDILEVKYNVTGDDANGWQSLPGGFSFGPINDVSQNARRCCQ